MHPKRGFFTGTHGAAAQAVLFLGQHDDRATLGSFIGERGQLGGLGQFPGRYALDGDQLDRLAVAQGDRAGLVEQQHVHIPGGFHRPT